MNHTRVDAGAECWESVRIRELERGIVANFWCENEFLGSGAVGGCENQGVRKGNSGEILA